MADVVRSVAVLGLVILALWGASRFLTDTPDEPTRAVDYAGAARNAQPAVGFGVLTPDRVPTGWRVTSARLDEDRRWRLGAVTDDDEFVGLVQTDEPESTALRELAAGSSADGSTRIDGQEWAQRRSPRGDLVLVRRSDDSTLVVTSSAGIGATEAYVERLTTSSRGTSSTGSTPTPSASPQSASPSPF